ncbi:UDP-N-acetylmuramoyl-L-alanine--D-glutamate ligase [Hydrogenovibrio halophilus]|uniref:UDP-N-acetylmuramoyl-L-alanine--D-glutamate ligase n=1 Tax=Hydrogenovibrio halophilus TaxID=373391 RepID=UPI00037CB757|nr:UDP-N-acetylmuramoyl-L-alanine--D-glutamate ligase [Hydrogenovibrio halophilus]
MYLVAGLGLTGQSVLNYFASQGEPCLAYDTRSDLAIASLQAQFPEVAFATGTLPGSWRKRISTLVLSPGLARSEPWVQRLVDDGIEVIGDIELFARAAGSPIVAITGSNGKSTVTTLVSQALALGGYQVGMGGNIGQPALNLLCDARDYDVYVLELSSFQLETTYSLQCTSAAILNVCEDHMDRYPSLADYIEAKMSLLSDTDWAVLPDDPRLTHLYPDDGNKLVFGLSEPLPGQSQRYGVLYKNDQAWLGWGSEAVVPVAEMCRQGQHDQLNALAMMALCRPFRLSQAVFAQVLACFNGLPHRTQRVGCFDGVTWINDSKGTNVGASVTAIASTANDNQGRLFLLAGGVDKAADFAELGKAVRRYVAGVILFGQDRETLAGAMPSERVTLVPTLQEAVQAAAAMSAPGDTVLLSPACASFDQFDNYAQRGEVFMHEVEALYEPNDATH